MARSANSVLRNASPSSFGNLTFARCYVKHHRKAPHIPGGTSSTFARVPARARNGGPENLLNQAPPLAIHIVRSRRDLAKPHLQVVHSRVLASCDSPVTPRPNKGHTFAWDFCNVSSTAVFCVEAGLARLPRLRIARSWRDLPIPSLEMLRLPVLATSLLHVAT